MSRRRVPYLSGLALVVVLVVGLPTAAFAAFAATGANTGKATAATLPAPGKPDVTDSTAAVTVAWTGTALSTGRAVDSYQVRRTVGTTTTTVCTTSALTCTDSRQSSTATYVVVAKVGGWSSSSASTSFISDYTAPTSTLTVTPGVNGSGWVQSTNPTFQLSATDTGLGVQAVSYKLNGGTTQTTTGNSVTFSPNLQGTVTVQYWATDKAGNIESANSTTYKIDGVAPAAPSAVKLSNDSGKSSTDLITNVAAQTLSGKTDANAAVKVVYGASTKTTTADASGNFSVTLTLTEGQQAATITATDPAGNASMTTAQLRLDTIAPTVSVESPADGADYTDSTWSQTCASRGGPGVCGTSADASGSGVDTVTYELRQKSLLGNNYSCWNGASFTSAQCGQDEPVGSGPSPWWSSVPTNSMPNGFIIFSIQMRFVVTVTDVAGNVTTQTTNFTKF